MVNCVVVYFRVAKPGLRGTLTGHPRGSLPVSRPCPIVLRGIHDNQRVENLVAGALSHPEDVIIFRGNNATLLELLFDHASGIDIEHIRLSLEKSKYVIPLSLLRLRHLLISLNHEWHEAIPG
jgi:hypothetical protein